ncbi:MAG: DoxX family protein, partial [Bacteroidales bacterium]|nr:DoxX family protein [Bacteroidales bacterium]
MKTINTYSKIILGLVFIFSGFVKGIDPLGTTYKFVDYFMAFGFDFMETLSLPLAFLLNAAEFLIGISLLFSVKIKYSAWAVFIFMVFFTILTFFLAIFNPVSDCGCFGDAIIFTNWQTFYKNIFLMIFVVIVFVNRNKYQTTKPQYMQWGILSGGLLIILVISIYCYNHLPIIDFRPYSINTNISEKMLIPDNAPQPEYKTTLEYKKNNKIKEFSLNNLPDSTWEWVSTQNKLVKEGYVPPIHDFTISTLDGNDITDIVLNENKFTFILVAYDLKNCNIDNINSINSLSKYCDVKTNCNFICLTSSLDNEIEKFKNNYNSSFSFYNSDEITLKTIIRSNPGIILIKNGIILEKWHHNDIPEINSINKNFIRNT